MSMTDPIADLLTRIRNAQRAGFESLEVPHSRMREGLVKILEEEGFVAGHKINRQGRFPSITILLKYTPEGKPVIRSLKKVSRPGRRVYVGCDEIPPVLSGLGVSILSTPKGLLTHKKARQLRVGGELLVDVY